MRWPFLVLLLGLLGSCGSVSHASSEFRLASLDGEVPGGAPVIITLLDDHLAGNGPINRWSALLDGRHVGQVLSTRMAGPPERMELERRLFAALKDSELVSLKDGALALARNGKQLARLEPVQAGPSAGDEHPGTR